jgi:pantothenate kinase-related protein Tda10
MAEEALKLALEALESKHIVNCGAWRVQQDQAIAAIKEALAQPEQKSVAMADYMALTEKYVALKSAHSTWVGLTDEEIEKHWKKQVGTVRPNYSFTRAIESKLKEKNEFR